MQCLYHGQFDVGDVTMLATGSVNLHYLLILLLPSVVACIMVALTWYFRAKRRRESEAKPRGPSKAQLRGRSSAKRRPK